MRLTHACATSCPCQVIVILVSSPSVGSAATTATRFRHLRGCIQIPCKQEQSRPPDIYDIGKRIVIGEDDLI